MTGWLDVVAYALVTGLGATAIMDGIAWLQRSVFGTPAPDYGLVGRWLGHLARGKARHEAITRALPLPAERLVGWAAHYLTGVVFAGVLPALCGQAWMRHPSLVPALAVGLATVALPFLVMQPAMGLGIAASRTPDPAARRFRSLAAHLAYGVGLYLAAVARAAVTRVVAG